MYPLLQYFFELALTEIYHYEGTATQSLSDGFIALFGAPVAHEDHAQRAVLAACGLQRRLEEQRAVFGLPNGEALTVRMGIHTGMVIVGRIGIDQRMDYTAVGDTLHLATSLQECAVPGTIPISTATCRFVQYTVRLEALRQVQVPGRAECVAVYQVLGVAGNVLA
jgi:class 3 adenylate cyclase